MQRIAIVSTCAEDWGGSEELWGRSVPHLQKFGFEVSAIKYYINREHPEFKNLADNGVNLIDIFPRLSISKRIKNKTSGLATQLAIHLKLTEPKGEDFSAFINIMATEKPSLVVISQGINFDGLKLAYQCFLLGIPYVVVSQKAVDFYWPHKDDRTFMLKALEEAAKCYFVSHHNLRLTEEQFGKRLPNGQVIFNPVKLSGNLIPFPPSKKLYKLACLGRLFLLDKGQDVLIRILSAQKWKERPIMISFIGKGVDENALKEMASLLGVTNVEFLGQVDDIENMWKDYHALVLPSRSEGLPLSMVEAMSAGRPVIISNAGGNTELVHEGVTGFIGYPNEESFDQAMERAWEKRDEWEQIGSNGAKYVAENVPKHPEAEFAALINQLIHN